MGYTLPPVVPSPEPRFLAGFRELTDRDLVLPANVEDSPDRLRVLQELKDRPGGVLHVRESPRLRAVAIDGNRFAGQRAVDDPAACRRQTGRSL